MGTRPPDPQGAITNGKTCLSVYGHLLCKESRGKDMPSIEDYLRSEADLSLMAAHPPMTRDEMIKEGKELPDTVVIRADSDLPFRGGELRHYGVPAAGISQVRLEDRGGSGNKVASIPWGRSPTCP